MSKRVNLLMLISLSAMLLLAAPAARGQTVWYVDDDNCPGPGTGTPVDPFCKIQDGIDASTNGDTVQVADGTYTEVINFGGKAIAVRSSGGAGLTTIDGTGLSDSVVKCVNGESADTVLDGFTITGGTGTATGDAFNGGGMYNSNSSPTVQNCTFTLNFASAGTNDYGNGGGMYNSNSHPAVVNCVFSDNSVLGAVVNMRTYGGGMCNDNNSSPTVSGCIFSGNSLASTFSQGGGMANLSNSNAAVIDCIFMDNPVVSHWYALGGGLFSGDSSPLVERCTFSSNTSVGSGPGGGGGGVAVLGGNAVFVNCTFAANHARTLGGGLSTYAGETITQITNCLFTGNTCDGYGGAIGVGANGGAAVANCTLAHNAAQTVGGGIASNSSSNESSLTNCLLWGNSDNNGTGTGESAQVHNQGSSVTSAVFTCIEGCNAYCANPNDHNIGDAPAFVDSDGNDDIEGTEDDDLRLLPMSPCIDAGSNGAVPLDTMDLNTNGNTTEPIPFDLDGNQRFTDDPCTADTGDGTPPIVDMGAYEYVPDCNTNDVDDSLDIAVGTSTDCNANGCPDECELVTNDCNTNAVPDDCEADFDGDGFIDECDADIDDDGIMNDDDVCDYTPLGGNIVTDLLSPLYGTLRGDLDGDCDCDLIDFAILQGDFTGPGAG